MTELEYNDINMNRGIFPDNKGYFSPKIGNMQFFSFLKLENIIQMFQTLFKCLNGKTAYNSVEI